MMHDFNLGKVRVTGTVLALSLSTIALCSSAYGGSTRSDGGMLAIDTNWADNTVSIVNLADAQEKNRITVGAKPYDIKSDKLGRFAYTTLSGGHEISVIDLQANLESEKITVGESPRDFVMTKDFDRIVVANSGSNSISVVDVKNRKELYQVDVGLIPYGVGLADDGHTAIVSNWGEGTVSFVDLDNRKETKRVTVGHLPYTVAVNQATNAAYVNTFGDDKVVVLDLKSQAVVQEIPVGKSPWGLAVTPSGKKVAVANFYSGSISVIDVTDPSKPDGIKVMTYDLNGKKAGDVIQPSATARKPTDKLGGETVAANGRTKHVAINEKTNMVMWTDLAANTVNTLDLNTGTWTGSTSVGHAPYGIDFLPQELKKMTSAD